jgi:hypothetical protein
MPHIGSKESVIMRSFAQWQSEVVAVLQSDFEELLPRISLDNVDWSAWRDFYTQGHTPRAAVNRALERDL